MEGCHLAWKHVLLQSDNAILAQSHSLAGDVFQEAVLVREGAYLMFHQILNRF